MKFKGLLLVLTVVIAVLLLAACGKEEKKASPTAAAAPTKAATVAATTAAGATAPAAASPAASPAATTAPAATKAQPHDPRSAKVAMIAPKSWAEIPDAALPAETGEKTALPGGRNPVKLVGAATTPEGLTPSRKIAEELMSNYYYSTLPIRPNDKPKYGGVLTQPGPTYGHFSPLNPAPGQWGLIANGIAENVLTYNNIRISTDMNGRRENLARIVPRPALAEKWEAPDDKTYVFYLRKGVKWQDVPPVNGREFVAEDVKFAYDKYRSTEYIGRDNVSPIDTIETPDKYTVVFKMKAPFPGFPWVASDWGMNLFSKECYEEKNCLEQKPIGTGPFMLKEFTPNVSATFVRNPNYWKKDKWGQQLPYLDGFKIMGLADPASIIAGYRTGQLDSNGMIGFSLGQFEALRKSNPDSVIQVGPSYCGGDNNLVFNLEEKPFDDVRVRRAISLATDREGLAMTLFQGAFTSDTIIPEHNFGFDIPPAWAEWPWKGKEYLQKYDPEAAKKLLAEAGLPNGFKTKMTWSKGSDCSRGGCDQVFEFLAQGLKKAGIEVELNPLGLNENSQLRIERKWTGIVNTISGKANSEADGFAYNAFNSKSSVNRYGPRAGQDALLDDLTAKQRINTNPVERLKLWNDIHDRLYEQMYWVPVGGNVVIRMWQPWLENAADHNCQTLSWVVRGTDEVWFNEKAPKR
ncbi:MAG: ABC transporter substrate-binding protein [Chloroflexi bacterium]|nr:ABC transporter substrate-binding protein [Chloroflexota bacterium]